MSDGRRHGPPRYDFIALAKLAKQACHDWPACRCGAQWPSWDATVEEWIDPAKPPATEDELSIALDAIVCMLACVTEHCPNRRIRMAAKLQLAQPMCGAVVAGIAPKDVIAALRAQGANGATVPGESTGELSHPKTGDADAPYEPPLDRGPFGKWALSEEARRLGDAVERRKDIRVLPPQSRSVVKRGDQ